MIKELITIKSNELYHYGRKGQKWGQHIFGIQRSKSSSTKKKESLSDRYDRIVKNKEIKALIKDANKVTAKAEPGKTKMVYGRYRQTLAGYTHSAMHIVDQNGKVKLSYFNGINGERCIAAGKEYVDKNIDLSKYFYNAKDINIEYDVYK